MSARDIQVRPRQLEVGDLITVGGSVMRITEVSRLSNGARVELDHSGRLALPSTVVVTVTRPEPPRPTGKSE